MKQLSIATLFAAVSGFVLMWVASWALDVETEYRYFTAFWGLFFASAGLIDGITHETTRSVAGARETGVSGTANPWKFGAMTAGLVSIAVIAVGLWMMRGIVPMAPNFATSLLVFGLVSYIFQAVLSGILSGAKLWDRYAWLVALDSGIRLLLAILAWVLGWGLPAFLIITVIGALSWLAVLGFAPVRVALDVDRSVFLTRVVSAMLASGASAALITGFPTAVSAAFPDGDAEVSILVAAVNNAVMLTRAPVLVPLQRFQSALVVRFVEKQKRVLEALVTPVAVVLGVGVAGFAAAWALGPWILKLAFPPEMAMPGLDLGLLTFASAFMGALMITGVATLALEKHRWYVAGWITAGVTSFALLFLAPLGVVGSVILALFVGPLVGALVHVVALVR